MSPEQLAQEEKAREFIGRCRAGFRDHFEWLGWLKKHTAEIRAMPVPLQEAVWAAWNNSTAKEFSR